MNSFAMKQYQDDLYAFCTMVRDQDFVVLDTETTGLHEGEIVQIAIVAKNGEVLLNSYVKPRYPIPSDATRIHGITDETVKDAPTFVDLISQIEPLLTGTNVIVYNAVYDRKMLHQSAECWNLLKRDWKTLGAWHCAMEAAAVDVGEWNAYRGSFRWQKLAVVVAGYKLPISGEHTALGDAMMTLELVKAMSKNRLERE